MLTPKNLINPAKTVVSWRSAAGVTDRRRTSGSRRGPFRSRGAPGSVAPRRAMTIYGPLGPAEVAGCSFAVKKGYLGLLAIHDAARRQGARALHEERARARAAKRVRAREVTEHQYILTYYHGQRPSPDDDRASEAATERWYHDRAGAAPAAAPRRSDRKPFRCSNAKGPSRDEMRRSATRATADDTRANATQCGGRAAPLATAARPRRRRRRRGGAGRARAPKRALSAGGGAGGRPPPAPPAAPGRWAPEAAKSAWLVQPPKVVQPFDMKADDCKQEHLWDEKLRAAGGGGAAASRAEAWANGATPPIPCAPKAREKRVDFAPPARLSSTRPNTPVAAGARRDAGRRRPQTAPSPTRGGAKAAARPPAFDLDGPAFVSPVRKPVGKARRGVFRSRSAPPRRRD
ncbi:hypothetical protein SO694_00074188 [Aureococcus anophagefferens]|uniref:Uncharacterized protein n=1 Tax=Aureococcus anophagefferens TaxID=44056 RepID=A0ABR1FHI5_AURAN